MALSTSTAAEGDPATVDWRLHARGLAPVDGLSWDESVWKLEEYAPYHEAWLQDLAGVRKGR